MEFKIGDIIKFKDDTLEKNKRIIKWERYSDSVTKVKHGSTKLDKDYYNKYGCKIIDIEKGLYVIRYKDYKGKFVQLGFGISSLELIGVRSWRDKIETI
jgi:hypothetical protein